MFRLRLFLFNAFLSACAGALMQFLYVVLSGSWTRVDLFRIIDMAFIGAVIGSICLLALFSFILVTRWSEKATVSINAVICFLLVSLIFVANGISSGIWTLSINWPIILIISEAATILLSIYWYRKIRLYNRLLEKKKESLRRIDSDDSPV